LKREIVIQDIYRSRVGERTGLGKVARGVGCSVSNCGGQAVRSISAQSMTGSSLKVSTEQRKAYLCDDHFKQWKKETKKAREVDRLRFT
jgi:hypothetical protein